MDRNTITGLLLIALILIVSTFIFQQNAPEPQKKERIEVFDTTQSTTPEIVQDSVEARDTVVKSSPVADEPDTLNNLNLPAGFQQFSRGNDEEVTLENDNLIVKVSSKGGRISYVEVKGYKTSDSMPLVLTRSDVSEYTYELTTGSQTISTADLYFKPENQTRSSVTMAVTTTDGKAIKQTYTLKKGSYLVGNKLELIGMNEIIPRKSSYIDLRWESKLLRHELDSTIALQNSTIHYKVAGETPDYLSETSDEQEKFKLPTTWVSFKQQFFCQTLITQKTNFINADLVTKEIPGPYLKQLTADLTLPFTHNPHEVYDMSFYFGPLSYKILRKLDLELERQVPLGWSFAPIGWVNRFIIIPVFNFLSKFLGNYGIIILLLTLLIKLLVLPLTYKSYLTMAKMKLLKPELDDLKAKYGEDMARMQSEQMKLYRRTGVSPFGGCLPLLLQMPFLIAMFRFFPSSIELRQEGFLWATDLSTYDNILPWFGIERLPFVIPMYGAHVSLWTLLMTVSTLIYTKMNNSLTNQPNEFKWLAYLMPIFFLGFFNNYAAGLSMYYFFFNILTFLQQYIFKLVVDDKKLQRQIEENKKKPVSQKKSALQRRLEEMQKQRQQQVKRK